MSKFHRDHYGSRPYAAFADDFVAGLDGWDPVDWARRFAASGARYVVLVTKHHDGWCLWPSSVVNPHRSGWFSERDLVGELADAVRAEGLRFGVYYSGGYDWTFEDHPIGSLSSGVVAWPEPLVAFAVGASGAAAVEEFRCEFDPFERGFRWLRRARLVAADSIDREDGVEVAADPRGVDCGGEHFRGAVRQDRSGEAARLEPAQSRARIRERLQR